MERRMRERKTETGHRRDILRNILDRKSKRDSKRVRRGSEKHKTHCMISRVWSSKSNTYSAISAIQMILKPMSRFIWMDKTQECNQCNLIPEFMSNELFLSSTISATQQIPEQITLESQFFLVIQIHTVKPVRFNRFLNELH